LTLPWKIRPVIQPGIQAFMRTPRPAWYQGRLSRGLVLAFIRRGSSDADAVQADCDGFFEDGPELAGEKPDDRESEENG
jgi:hypothetical protein